jgi:putative hydrolase of the HAD superfamily
MKIQAILFDLDRTLGIDHSLEGGVLEGLAEQEGVSLSQNRLLTVLSHFHTGKISLHKMLSELFPKRSRTELKHLAEKYRKICVGKGKETFTLLPGSEETVEKLLKKQIFVGIFTNGWTELQKAKAHALGFPVPLITSEEIGFWKPNPKAFHEAVKRFGVSTDTTLYVGDSFELDIVGSKKAGLLAGWVNLEGHSAPAKEPLPDFIFHSLLDLLDII